MDKYALIEKINSIEGLTDEERGALTDLLREHKKYGLVWEEKTETVEENLRDSLPVLHEVKERAIISDTPDAPNHILIEGDNLEALTALSYTHSGKIDVIYIDPPYNTGNKDFFYEDSYIDKEDAYRHSTWLSFMSKRLKIAKQLLSDRGVIFISIDDNEMAQLKLLCDEIFGENNFINNISINMNSLSGVKMKHTIEGKRYPAQKESLLLYRKSDKPLSLIIEKTHKKKWDKEYNIIIPELGEKDFDAFDFLSETEINEKLKGMHLVSLSTFTKENGIKITDDWLWENAYRIFGTKSNRPLVNKIINQTFEQQIVCYTNNEGNFRYFRSDFNHIARDPRIELVRAESNSSVFLSDNWVDISNDGGVAQEGGVTYPKGKKPLAMIKRIIKASNMKDATILDFFAGSGTTFHATTILNDEDDGNRTCILVQCKEKDNNICENTTYPRCRNVIQGFGKNVKNGLIANNLRYYKTDLLPREQTVRNKRRLMEAATDLLCIKNDIYKEVEEFGGKAWNKRAMRCFVKGISTMLVMYNELLVDEVAETLRGMEVEEPVKIYVFSMNGYPQTDNFCEVLDKVELCALPAAIYDAYKRVLPDRERRKKREKSNDTTFSLGAATPSSPTSKRTTDGDEGVAAPTIIFKEGINND